MSNDSLIILETMEEAKYYLQFLKDKDSRLKECLPLSLNPNIRAYLAGYNIESLNTAEIIDAQVYRSIMDKCEEWEQAANAHIREKKVELPENYFIIIYFYYLVLIWRHILWDIELLDRILSAGSYKKVFTFKIDRGVTGSPWVEDAELYMGDLANLYCSTRKINFIYLLLPTSSGQQTKAVDSVKPTSLSWYYTFCNKISFAVYQACFFIMSRRKSLLIPNYQYCFDSICEALLKRDGSIKIIKFIRGQAGLGEILQALGAFFGILFGRKLNGFLFKQAFDFALPVNTFKRFYSAGFSNEIQRKYLAETLTAMQNMMGGPGGYKGIDFSDLLRQKLERDLFPFLLDIHAQAYGLEKGLERLRPSLVMAPHNINSLAALGHITKKLHIPSVLLSHGSHVLHYDKYCDKEHRILAQNILIGDYAYSAVQSPYARALALKMMGDSSRIICIKPKLWGRAIVKHLKNDSTPFTIVHAGTYKFRHHRRYIYETSDEFLRGIIELAEVVARYPNIKLIFKLRRDPYELSVETIKSLLPKNDNIVIETERPFLEVLKEADLVVSYSSTTIEEALTNKVPVLLYGGLGRYAHIPTEPFSPEASEVKKAVAFVKDKESLQKYFAKLNDQRRSFSVPEESFRVHCFGDNDVIDFNDWAMKIIKN
ncbi:MAG: hypothetical protein HZA94_02335 [Candidatus Vogelbacteria bacterium]|nr:hypothetical protein [Candidatus Vogelbacteria bacterium]